MDSHERMFHEESIEEARQHLKGQLSKALVEALDEICSVGQATDMLSQLGIEFNESDRHKLDIAESTSLACQHAIVASQVYAGGKTLAEAKKSGKEEFLSLKMPESIEDMARLAALQMLKSAREIMRSIEN